MMSMSRNYINHKLNIYIVAGMLVMASCSDDFLRDNQDLPGNSSESVSFTASVALAGSSAGSRGATVSYEPLVLTDDDAPDYPLYLHSYEHPYGEDVAEMGEAASRGVQVNSPKDLYDTHKSFAVRSEFNSNGEELVHLHDTRRVNESGDNYVYWMPTDPHRWPSGGRLQFAAVAPYSYMSKLENAVYDENKISFSYTAEKSADGTTDAEAQTDLLAAVATMSREDSKEHDYRVPFTFNHALSAVKFAVRDVLKGKVISVTIRGVKGEGDCIYTADDNSLNGKFVWSNQSADESYTQIFNHPIEDGYANINDPDKDVVLNDKMPKMTFMLIPQVLTDNAEIEVIIERDPDENGNTFNKIKVKGKILDNEVKEWKPGHEYVYTISTSKSNWTYVFEVNGSYRNNTEIYMPSPADEEIYETFVEGGGKKRPYYEVVSYRYRSNNPAVKENLRWKASHGDGVQYYYTKYYTTFADKDAILYEDREKGASERASVPGSTWLTDLHDTPLEGSGSVDKERHDISFLSPIVTTDWGGDIKMYNNEAYSGNSEENPWDLSTCGGQIQRNTANCYVVDREGWYAIPLYYGNSIKNGQPNPKSWKTGAKDYENERYDGKDYTYYALSQFKDSRGVRMYGDGLETARIPDNYYQSAQLLWQETYDVIDKVKLATVKGEQMIVFHVNKDNLQQGNAQIGLSAHSAENFNKDGKNDPQIAWSWHIWFSEHWLNNAGLPNKFAKNNDFNTEFNDLSGMQEQGDLLVTVPRTSTDNHEFYVAPYNIGWCDAKNVRYLSRYNHMNFVQYDADGVKLSGKTAELPIIQDGRTIQYRIGNNVYFQFGRKDPFVGFIDNESDLKPKYGALDGYIKEPQGKTISYSIQNPHILFVGGAEAVVNNEWNKEDGWNDYTEYYTLWNNTAYDKTKNDAHEMTEMEYFTSQKTIYDPSPAGYMVPPSGFFKILFKKEPAWEDHMALDGNNKKIDNGYNENGSRYTLQNFKATLNGDRTTYEDHPVYIIYTSRNSTSKFFSLTGTGHRWYSTTQGGNPFGAGNNFNPQLVYLWSSNVTKNRIDRSAFSMSLGLDNNGMYIISAALNGRKSMARPVRCVQEEE